MTITRRGMLLTAATAPLAAVSARANANETFQSPFLALTPIGTAPFINRLSLDSLGRGRTAANLIRPPQGQSSHRVRRTGDVFTLAPADADQTKADWTLRCLPRSIALSGRPGAPPLGMEIDPKLVHATVLGLLKQRKVVELPAILQLPGHGSLRITGSPGATLNFDARRNLGGAGVKNNPGADRSYVSVMFEPGHDYLLELVVIHPEADWAEGDTLDGFRRDWLNIFQVNPRLGVLANNSGSDPCAFTLYKSALVAAKTPALGNRLAALDLIRMTLDRYLEGMKAYGLVGYTDGYEGADTISWKSPYDSLDSYPSLLIAAATYILETNDLNWARANLEGLQAWMTKQLRRDADGDGLVEYELSGNSGSWNNGRRPANWWDTIGFGHKDAYSNALTHWSLRLMQQVALRLKDDVLSAKWGEAAGKIHATYFSTFYNPQTGVCGGWRSADGQLHDYYFLFVNGLAVLQDLIPPNRQRMVMQRLLDKMKEVGLTDFRFGLPGNLVPIRREDYTHLERRWGGPETADGSDAFQIYENGGATACFAYFMIAALKKVGLLDPYHRIMGQFLASYNANIFQGPCENGMSRDWRTWSGECWGYEGFLADAYLPLLNVAKS